MSKAKNAHAVALGRLGGKKGGLARKRALPAGRRSEIARLAAKARWSKRKGIALVVAEIAEAEEKRRG
jgi:hypothetical protein